MQFSPISSQFTIIMLNTEWSKSISMSHKSYPHHCNAPKPSIGFRFCLPSHWTTAHPFMDGSHVTPITIIRLPSYHHHFKRQPTVAAQWQLIIVITAHITTTHDSPHDTYAAVPRVFPSSCASLLAIKIGTEIQRLGIKFLVYYHHQHHPPTHYKYGPRIGWSTAHSLYWGRPI